MHQPSHMTYDKRGCCCFLMVHRAVAAGMLACKTCQFSEAAAPPLLRIKLRGLLHPFMLYVAEKRLQVFVFKFAPHFFLEMSHKYT